MKLTNIEYERLAQTALDDIRSILQMDGGDIVLVAVENSGRVVKVRFAGMCASCPVSDVTLRGIVKKSLKKYLPQLEKLINVDLE